ncbi:MAG: hypothetical protein HRT44_10690 [Bdellovibrionales bacterium]|nr:hypothetical protein [Bdellovibrionales bacterium]NQZ19708.1 hypothetical protein [Bdellovibrionales bacterium]
MEAGLNSDIKVGERDFHIQTEDWGWDNPFIVTKIFSQGAVLKSFKIPYQEVLQSPFPSEQSIRTAIERQHQEILDRLISGHI